jgi:hypothetical protein
MNPIERNQEIRNAAYEAARLAHRVDEILADARRLTDVLFPLLHEADPQTHIQLAALVRGINAVHRNIGGTEALHEIADAMKRFAVPAPAAHYETRPMQEQATRLVM